MNIREDRRSKEINLHSLCAEFLVASKPFETILELAILKVNELHMSSCKELVALFRFLLVKFRFCCNAIEEEKSATNLDEVSIN